MQMIIINYIIFGKNKSNLIVLLYNDGFSTRDIADYLNISHMSVYRTIKKEN
jgi:predicted DNA-binding protein YlxM (UPF0122 family)